MSGQKRKREPAGDKKKGSGRGNDPTPAPPLKRQRADEDFIAPYVPSFTSQNVGRVGAPIPPRHLVGSQFHAAIEGLRDGGDEIVSTRFSLRVKVVSDGNTVLDDVPVGGTFSVFQHRTTGLVQGNLLTGANSAYVGSDDRSSVLPRRLSLQRARLESRAIKQLSDSGPAYAANAKISRFDAAKLVPDREHRGVKRISRDAPLGGIALASHLEDVTAKRAVGLEDVGSAIRAKVLTVKWRSLEGNSNAGARFRSDLLASFPQLGNKDVPAGGLNEGGISALKSHWDGNGATFSKQTQIEKIRIAHEDAWSAADRRFVSKFRALSSEEVRPRGWWRQNEGRVHSIAQGLQSKQPNTKADALQEFAEIREEYRTRKLVRHGIKSD